MLWADYYHTRETGCLRLGLLAILPAPDTEYAVRPENYDCQKVRTGSSFVADNFRCVASSVEERHYRPITWCWASSTEACWESASITSKTCCRNSPVPPDDYGPQRDQTSLHANVKRLPFRRTGADRNAASRSINAASATRCRNSGLTARSC